LWVCSAAPPAARPSHSFFLCVCASLPQLT
jgi:hypothetical protein